MKYMFAFICALFLSAQALANGNVSGYLKQIQENQNINENMFQLYRLASAGNSSASLVLGLLYQNPKDMEITEDQSKALGWLHLSALQGEKEAQGLVALAYYSGKTSVIKNDKVSYKFSTLAALQGNKIGQVILANHFTYGSDASSINYKMGLMWALIAKANGYEDPQMISFAKSNLTNTDIAQVRKEASMCINSGYSNCLVSTPSINATPVSKSCDTIAILGQNIMLGRQLGLSIKEVTESLINVGFSAKFIENSYGYINTLYNNTQSIGAATEPEELIRLVNVYEMVVFEECLEAKLP